MSSLLTGTFNKNPKQSEDVQDYINPIDKGESNVKREFVREDLSFTAENSTDFDGETELCCSETFLSTPPSEDSLKNTPSFTWNESARENGRITIHNGFIATDQSGIQNSTNFKVYTSSLSGSAVTKTTSVLHPLLPTSSDTGKGDERRLEKRRMNTNGYDRSRLTGGNPPTSDPNTSPWLADVTNPSHVHSRQAESGMLASRLISGQEGRLVLSSGSQGSIAPAPLGSLFRPPITLYPNVGQYNPSLYSSTCTASPLYSSSMYTLHGQPAHLSSPFSSLYPQLAASNYGHGAMLPASYPHIESYSAVLAQMGSHVQQSQLPHTAAYLPGHIPQYPTLAPGGGAAGSTHAHMTSANTPASSVPHLQGHPDLLKHEALAKSKIADYEARGRLPSAPPISGEVRAVGRPPHSPHSQAKAPKMKDNIKNEALTKDMYNKVGVPCGKEGSLKHRILTRPPDIQIEGSALTDSKSFISNRIKTEVPSPKRTKTSSSISHLPTVAEAGPSENVRPPIPLTTSQPADAQPQYPLHFMKGSIIELANGSYKRIEDLQTEDFVNSAEFSSDLKIDSSTVVRIEENLERGTAILSLSVGEHKLQVTVEPSLEHPFFVFGRGWSSFSPDRSVQRYGLHCQKLSVGDVCISLTHKDVASQAAQINQEATEARRKGRSGVGSVRFTTPSRMPPPTSISRGLSLEEGQRQLSIKDKLANQIDHNEDSTPKSSLLQGLPPEDMPPRKRRWSAPDKVSVDTDSTPPSKQTCPGKEDKGTSESPANKT